MDYPLHTSTFKPIVDLIARLKLLITATFVPPPPKNGPGCTSRHTRKEKQFIQNAELLKKLEST